VEADLAVDPSAWVAIEELPTKHHGRPTHCTNWCIPIWDLKQISACANGKAVCPKAILGYKTQPLVLRLVTAICPIEGTTYFRRLTDNHRSQLLVSVAAKIKTQQVLVLDCLNHRLEAAVAITRDTQMIGIRPSNGLANSGAVNQAANRLRRRLPIFGFLQSKRLD